MEPAFKHKGDLSNDDVLYGHTIMAALYIFSSDTSRNADASEASRKTISSTYQ